MTAAAARKYPRLLLLATLALSCASLGSAVPAAPAASPRDVARTFYDAFIKGDVATLQGLYAPDVKFRDEIFTFSDRAGTMGMWRVLVDPKSGGRFSYEILGADANTATVRWIADYKFPSPKFGRKVHNVVTATLVVRNGRIVDHHDSFSWEKWSRQAFPLGALSSWPPVAKFLKMVIRGVLAKSAGSAPPPAASPSADAKQDGGPGMLDHMDDPR
ncbi:MAG: nuclear transport factor 2 family protein [Planctomycetes bacterium]|nr:nuclear transport factor 2 family protein [Planctomycetota bacterium]